MSSPNLPTGNISLYHAYLLMKTERFEEVLELTFQHNARIYSMSGEKNNAINFIHSNIINKKTSKYWDLLNNPYYDNLREDPRFHEMIEMEKKKHEGLLKIYRGL